MILNGLKEPYSNLLYYALQGIIFNVLIITFFNACVTGVTAVEY
jgi:hypothetical protein